MNKEKIEISLKEFEEKELCYGNSTNEFEYIDDDIIYYDLSKEYEEKRLILKRKSDNKFFKFEFRLSPHFSLDEDGLDNDNPLIGIEVFPKEKIITIYE